MDRNNKRSDFLEYYGCYHSPLGPLLMISDAVALTGLYMNREIPPSVAALPVFDKTAAWLDDYFRGSPGKIDFPIRADGTAFQKLVWKYLLAIPYGQTQTYGQIARQVAENLGREKMSAQAVGGAVGKNPISILIPCHRVVGVGGTMTGYAGGISNKQWLLEHENWKGVQP